MLLHDYRHDHIYSQYNLYTNLEIKITLAEKILGHNF